MIQFFRNIWNAQRNADAVRAFEHRANKMIHENCKLVLENVELRKQIAARGRDGKFTKRAQ